MTSIRTDCSTLLSHTSWLLFLKPSRGSCWTCAEQTQVSRRTKKLKLEADPSITILTTGIHSPETGFRLSTVTSAHLPCNHTARLVRARYGRDRTTPRRDSRQQTKSWNVTEAQIRQRASSTPVYTCWFMVVVSNLRNEVLWCQSSLLRASGHWSIPNVPGLVLGLDWRPHYLRSLYLRAKIMRKHYLRKNFSGGLYRLQI